MATRKTAAAKTTKKSTRRKATPVAVRRAKRKSAPASAAKAKANGKPQTIGGYLIQRLQDYGLKDLFGIPGDYVLQFYGML
jgi:indolepyruvate decarboxylase